MFPGYPNNSFFMLGMYPKCFSKFNTVTLPPTHKTTK